MASFCSAHGSTHSLKFAGSHAVVLCAGAISLFVYLMLKMALLSLLSSKEGRISVTLGCFGSMCIGGQVTNMVLEDLLWLRCCLFLIDLELPRRLRLRDEYTLGHMGLDLGFYFHYVLLSLCGLKTTNN